MKEFNFRNASKEFLPLLIAILLLSILLFSSIKFANFKKGQWEKDGRSLLLEMLVTKKSRIEQALYSRIYYTKSISAYVSLHPGISTLEFDNLANELIHEDSVITTMSLARDCIIGAVYPEKGHEEVIGLDLLAHPKRREIVEKTIETQNSFVAGPVELVEGGVAFISYTPIFDRTSSVEDDFWGLTDIVIYKDKLFNEAGLKKSENGFDFVLKGYDGQGMDGAVFFGNEDVFEQSPVKVSIKLPYGEWILAASPVNGWSSYSDQDNILYSVLLVGSFIISILIWLFARAMLRIDRNEKELKAIFRSMSSLVIELDSEGRYLNIAPANEELLYKPREELLYKTVFEIFEPEIAKTFYKAITKCLNNRRLVTLEYPLIIGDKETWFSARLSLKSASSVIFQAYDITVQKKNQEALAASEKNLKELNATKDKFFSIIAHDLKSPFNSIMGLSEILSSEFDEIPTDQKKELIDTIYESSAKSVALIDNLLDWSRSQRGLLKYNPTVVKLADVVNENIERYLEVAEIKKIELISRIEETQMVVADTDMLSTVIRNLISNAIKFTSEGGRVEVSSRSIHENGVNKIEVIFEDNGIGIDKEVQMRLFDIENSISSKGTNAETGTGLGLIVCKEFVEKQGQKIWVESEINAGSRFIFTLEAV